MEFRRGGRTEGEYVDSKCAASVEFTNNKRNEQFNLLGGVRARNSAVNM